MLRSPTIEGMRERIETLEEENRQLRERIDEMTGMDKVIAARRAFGFTQAEGSIFMMLVTRGKASHDQIAKHVCGLDNFCEFLDPLGVVRSHVKRMRRKTRPKGIDVETLYSFGYIMLPEVQARSKEILKMYDI